MDIVEAVANLDGAPELHMARLLILINAFGGKDGGGEIEGLTKLAKLDFLLRYPVMLERALAKRGETTRDVIVDDYERHSVESEMVRYRFGPWDHRYREQLNVLIAKGLIGVSVEGRKTVIALTKRGRGIAGALATNPAFEPYARRSTVLRRFFDLTGSHLMRFIYDTFPEVITLRSNEPIPT